MKEMNERAGAESKKVRKEHWMLGISMLISDAAFLGLAAWRYELFWNEILTAAVVLVFAGLLYLMKVDKTLQKNLWWYVGLHFFELTVIFISYGASGVLRPVLAVPVLVTVLAGMEAGIFSMVLYTAVSALICADPTEVILLYFLSGFVGIGLFAGRKKGKELLVNGVCFFVMYTLLYMVLTVYAYMEVQGSDIAAGAVGALLQLLPVGCFLPFMTESGVYLPGISSLSAAVSESFPAIVEFKERKPLVYKHSLLVANLSARAAAEIDANVLLSQAGGLYHEIGQGIGEDCELESLRICKKYRLPAALQDIVKEHNPDKKTPSSKEAVIVMLSDTIISTMEQQRRKNPELKFDTAGLIKRVFKIRESSGAFMLSGLTKKEISVLQEYYISALR